MTRLQSLQLTLRSPLAQRLILVLALFSTALTVVSTSMQLYAEYRTSLGDIEEQLDAVPKVHLASLVQSSWATNQKDVSLLLHGIVWETHIEYAAIVDHGQVVAEAGRRTSQDTVERRYSMIHTHLGRPYSLGTLVVSAGIDPIYRQIREHALAILFNTAMTMFLLAVFAFVLLHVLLTRHLLAAAEYVHALDLNKPGEPLRLRRRERPRLDELDDLVSAINSMQLHNRAILAELHNYRSHLEDMVATRTAQLKAANDELESFAYSVSHDLRAPLRGIDGFSQALLEDYADKLDATGLDYLQRVRIGAQRMSQLIDDLLKLSRITRAPLQAKTIELSAMAGEILDHLSETQPERRVERLISPSLQASGDPGLIRVLMENLLGNAWKYSAKRPQARIEFGCMTDEGETVYFVRDDGVGFDMQYANKLFGAFQRLHHQSDFEGTGIGLATAQRIVHRHNGRIWAKGQLDAGAVFFFTLGEPHED